VETIRKTLASYLLAALVVASISFTACSSEGPAEQTGNTNTEDMVEGADGGLDSLELPADTTQ
jgi:hypothetical protein